MVVSFLLNIFVLTVYTALQEKYAGPGTLSID
jgi:hypothetical protein